MHPDPAVELADRLPCFLSRARVIEVVGLSDSELNRRILLGEFPAPYMLSIMRRANSAKQLLVWHELIVAFNSRGEVPSGAAFAAELKQRLLAAGVYVAAAAPRRQRGSVRRLKPVTGRGGKEEETDGSPS